MSKSFDQAVETARHHIPIMMQIRRPDCWCGYTIVVKSDGGHAVYDSDAWDEPTETPSLPWSPPAGTPVATVGMDGTVRPIEHEA